MTCHRLRTYLRNKLQVKTMIVYYLCLMMIISKKPLLIAPHYDTARVWLPGQSAVSAIGGGLMRENVSGLTNASIWGHSRNWTCDWRILVLRFPLCSDYRYQNQKLAYQPTTRETTSGKYLLWNSRPNDCSRYNYSPLKTINRFKSKRANSMAKNTSSDSHS